MSLRSVDLPAPLGPTAHGEAATGRCTKMKVDFIVDDDVSGPSTQNVLDDPGVVDTNIKVIFNINTRSHEQERHEPRL